MATIARVKSPRPPLAGAHLLQALHRQRRRYRKRFRRCREKPSTKAVHSLRTEGRRLLVILAMLQGLTAADELKTAQREVGRQLKLVAKLRDTQVHLGEIESQCRAHPALASFYRRLRRKEQTLRASAARELKAADLKPVASVEAWLRTWVEAGGNDTLCRDAILRALAKKHRRAVERRPAVWTGREVHCARIALRELRYLVECLQPLLPTLTDDRLDKVHACQSRMGEIHDLEILGARLAAHVRGRRRLRKSLEPFLGGLIHRHDELADQGRREAGLLFRTRTGVLAALARAGESWRPDTENA
jgi:CHAD domain-containing protein